MAAPSIVEMPDGDRQPKSRKRLKTFAEIHDNADPPEVYVELSELQLGTTSEDAAWKETTRWLTYEQDFDEEIGHWSLPHVSALEYQSLDVVRKAFAEGIFLFDKMEIKDFSTMVACIMQKVIRSRSIDSEEAKELFDILHQMHSHVHNVSFWDVMKKWQGRRMSRSITPFPQPIQLVQSANDISYQIEPILSTDTHDCADSIERQVTEGLPAKQSNIVKSAHSNSLVSVMATGAEGISVMTGEVSCLSAPLLVMVRLPKKSSLEGVIDLPLPVRFVCILVGPGNEGVDYHEAGRVLATLFTNQSFRSAASKALTSSKILLAYEDFLSEMLALPPGEWNEDTLLPGIANHKLATTEGNDGPEEITSHQEIPSPTYRPFLGIFNDLKTLKGRYLSDLKEFFHWQCLFTIIFTFMSCVAPAVAFGGLLQEVTHGRIGVTEILVATGGAGILYGALATQPLVILALTGPVLAFEESIYLFADFFEVDYLSWRFWIGMWSMVFIAVLAVAEMSVLIRLLTRFSEEVLTLTVAGFFVYQCGLQLYQILQRNPIMRVGHCNQNETNPGNFTTLDDELHAYCQPNTVLFSVFLCFGTFFLAYIMREIRHSDIFGHKVRQTVSDFGIFTAIVAVVLVAYFAQPYVLVDTLRVEGIYSLSDQAFGRDWVVHPLGVEAALGIGPIFGAIIPAMLLTTMVFIEHQMTVTVVCGPQHKLRKGSGYHWDLLLESFVVCLCSVFGLPWVCGAPIRSVQHLQGLAVYRQSPAPGSKPQLVRVREQRVTSVVIHMLMVISPALSVVLTQIPVSVVLGVFLYLAYISLRGVQLMSRLKVLLLFWTYKTNTTYTKAVRRWKVNLYTIVQLVLVICLWGVKLTPVSMAYPLLIVLIIPIHKFLTKFVYSENEIQKLDGEDAMDIENEEYDNLHVPY